MPSVSKNSKKAIVVWDQGTSWWEITLFLKKRRWTSFLVLFQDSRIQCLEKEVVMLSSRPAIWEGKAPFPRPGIIIVTFNPHSLLLEYHLTYTLLQGKMNGGSNLNRQQEGAQLPQVYWRKGTKVIVHLYYLISPSSFSSQSPFSVGHYLDRKSPLNFNSTTFYET